MIAAAFIHNCLVTNANVMLEFFGFCFVISLCNVVAAAATAAAAAHIQSVPLFILFPYFKYGCCCVSFMCPSIDFFSPRIPHFFPRDTKKTALTNCRCVNGLRIQWRRKKRKYTACAHAAVRDFCRLLFWQNCQSFLESKMIDFESSVLLFVTSNACTSGRNVLKVIRMRLLQSFNSNYVLTLLKCCAPCSVPFDSSLI